MKQFLKRNATLIVCLVLLLAAMVFDILKRDWFHAGTEVVYIVLVCSLFRLSRIAEEWRTIAKRLAAANASRIADLSAAQRQCDTLNEDNTALRVRIDTLTRINADAVKHRDRVEREFVKVCRENRHLEAEVKRLGGDKCH